MRFVTGSKTKGRQKKEEAESIGEGKTSDGNADPGGAQNHDGLMEP